jgi:hypothetical protein
LQELVGVDSASDCLPWLESKDCERREGRQVM